MELSLLHVQGNVLQHGRVQGALCVRFLEKQAHRGQQRAESRRGHGPVRRITKVSDLPPKKVLVEYIKLAKKLNDEGVKAPTRVKKPPRDLVVPDDLTKALKGNKAAQATFDKFSPSNKREYVGWITEAKTEATRNKRLETAIEWMADGKTRNWKYMNC